MSQGTKRPRNEVSEEIIIKSISNSIGQILRLSPNEDFRHKSFEVFNVSNTKEVEERLSKGLTSILQAKKSGRKKKEKKNQLEHSSELDSSDSLSLINLARAYDITDSTILEEIFQVENISEERNNLQIENEQNELPIAINYENAISLPENVLEETEVCVSDESLTCIVPSDEHMNSQNNSLASIAPSDGHNINSQNSSSISTAPSDEQSIHSQNSSLSQDSFDKNWLKLSMRRHTGKSSNKHIEKGNSLIQVNNSNDFCLCPEILEDDYSENALHNSQSLIHQKNLPLTDSSDSGEGNTAIPDFLEVWKSNSQNFLEVNTRQKNSDSSQSSFQ